MCWELPRQKHLQQTPIPAKREKRKSIPPRLPFPSSSTACQPQRGCPGCPARENPQQLGKSQDKAVSHPHRLKCGLRSPASVKRHCLPAQGRCPGRPAALGPHSLPAFFSPPSAPAFKGTSAHLLGHQQECPGGGMCFDAFALLGKDVRHP